MHQLKQKTYKTNNSSLELIEKTNNKINKLFHSGKKRKIVSYRKESFKLSTMIEVFQNGIFQYRLDDWLDVYPTGISL